MTYVIEGSMPTVWASTYTVKIENKKGESSPFLFRFKL